MSKQEEQKPGTTARQDKPTASVPSRTSAIKTATQVPLTPVIRENDTFSPADQKPSVERSIRRRQLLLGGLGAAVTLAGASAWIWSVIPHPEANQRGRTGGQGDRLVLQWNNATLQAIRELQPDVPVAARALAIVHTCMFDAWTAYDTEASSTRSGVRMKRPVEEHTQSNKAQAVSFAAYRALITLFPGRKSSFNSLMVQLGYNPESYETDLRLPAGIGNMAAQAVLDFRRNDGANQTGTLRPGAYSDYSRYIPMNTPDILRDPNRWQPLNLPDEHNHFTPQIFATAHWANVTPFALFSAVQFLPKTGPARYPGSLYTQQAQEILQYSARLTDDHKVIAEYWSNGPNREQAAGHWSLFAQFVAQRDNYTLDQNVKLFFALNNALLDASIACWAAKRAYDAPYPITTIHYLFRGKQVQAWAGPAKGFQSISGEYWRPYQPETLLSPAYPEYCSEHSTFGSTAAEILHSFTGSDRLGMSYTWPAHSSLIDPGSPADNTVLTWRTFSQAADQAGLSGRYSGTHFAQGDLDGRALGRKVGALAWQKSQEYFTGRKSGQKS